MSRECPQALHRVRTARGPNHSDHRDSRYLIALIHESIPKRRLPETSDKFPPTRRETEAYRLYVG